MWATVKRVFLRKSRIAPAFTIITGAIFISAGLLGFFKLELAQGVIVSLLILLAMDAYIERIHYLDKIVNILSQDARSEPLRRRESIPTPDRFAKHASSIHVLAISALSIVTQYQSFYKNKLREGCQIDFLLLQPESPALDSWQRQNLDSAATVEHVRSTLKVLEALSKDGAIPRRCNVRLMSMFAPFSIVGIDFEKSTARMLVEFHGYKTALDQRGHIEISKEDHPYWFDFFISQFKAAWEDAQPHPTGASRVDNAADHDR